MKLFITRHFKLLLRKIIISCLAFLLVLAPLTAYKNLQTNLPTKLKFKSMLLSKTNLDIYVNDVNFDHFVFQCINSSSTGNRHTYGLVVYVIDKNGNKMNNNIDILIDAKKQPTTGVNERDEHIYLTNYKMTKSQYNAIVAGVANFDALKFEAVSKTDGHGYANYVSYFVYPVDAQEGPALRGMVKYNFTNDNYLNPSPPAPPL